MIEILADSLNVATGDRITTFLLKRFPYTLVQEPSTHRILRWSGHCVSGDLNPFGETVSRSSASSRAIPISKIIERILEDPFIPTWTAKQKGMQGKFDALDKGQIAVANDGWRKCMYAAIEQARILDEAGIHKQHANDLLKPYMRIPILVTGTEWENFFNLRCNKKTVRPGFYEQAVAMKEAYNTSEPVALQPGQWHIPFSGRLDDHLDLKTKLKIVTARCARLSYASHDGVFDRDRDISLHDTLLKEKHSNPFEHSAMAVDRKLSDYPEYAEIETDEASYIVNTRNFRGFYSYRAHLEDGIDV
jgi:hypothetical protein